jgi:hypothetical protein
VFETIAHNALNKLARAAKRGTGCRLSAREIAALNVTKVGELWAEPDPRSDDLEPFVMQCPRAPISRNPQDHINYERMLNQWKAFAPQQEARWIEWAIRNGKRPDLQK